MTTILSPADEKYRTMFIARITAHREQIQKYAARIGLSYPDHDADKLTDAVSETYCLNEKRDYEPITPAETELLRGAGMKHRLCSPHHPEFWDKEHIENMTDIRHHPTSLFNCTRMPPEALTEMCVDWCAMAEEYGNTPFEWLDHIRGKRYIFTAEQEAFILQTLHRIWD